MKIIRTYRNIAEGGFARSLLEAAGIDAFLPHEFAATSGPEFAIWGIQLQVPDEDVERALEILNGEAGLDSRLPAVTADESVPLEHEVNSPNHSNPQATEPREIPRALAIVAIIFLLVGVGAVIGMVVSLLSGNVWFDFDVLGIPTYFGLRRFSRGWRTYALLSSWVAMIFCPIIFLYELTLTTSTPANFTILGAVVGHVNPVWVSIVCIPIFLLSLWQYRVLTRPDIYALFFPQP